MPLSGESGGVAIYPSLSYPHEIYANAKVMLEDSRVAERDAPDWGNNQAFLKIVMDPRRSSYQGGSTWVWPNDEDTLPY